METFWGVLYLAVGLSLSTTIVSRLVQYWDGFVLAQKLLLGGVLFIMFGYTQRGIELLWFNGPPIRPAAYVAIVGVFMALTAVLMPVDSRLRPQTWKESMREQDPENYRKYMDILAKSQENRKLDQNEERTVDTGFDKRHDPDNNPTV